MLNLQRLRTFHEVASRRSFSAAAEALGYTQSSVSQQIAVLERELGVTLLDRAGRPVRPTAAGEAVLAHSAPLLGHARAIQAELRDLHAGESGSLKVGGFYTAWSTFLPGVVARFARTHPRVQLDLRQLEPEPALRALRAGELDLAVVYRMPGDEDDAGLAARLLREDVYAVALPARHRLARAGAVDLRELAGERWVCPPLDAPYTRFLFELCRERGGFTPEIGFQTPDIAMAQPLVASGLAVALMPELGLSPRHQGVAVRPLADAPIARSVWAVRPEGRRHPAAAAMEALLAS